jgi:hypothetical protein
MKNTVDDADFFKHSHVLKKHNKKQISTQLTKRENKKTKKQY